MLPPHDYDNICMSIHPMTKVTGVLDILIKFITSLNYDRISHHSCSYDEDV